MKVLVLTGPTGTGKTEVAAILAERHGLEVISADSRQVYAWLDLGTAKPGPELRQKVKFHMIDLVEPHRIYSAADYARDALAVMRRLQREGRRFIVVGGSGLYIRALFEPFFEVPKPTPELRKKLAALSPQEAYARLKEIDPERAAQLHPHDVQRITRALEIWELTGKTVTELARSRKEGREFEPRYVVLTLPRSRLAETLDRRFDKMLEAGLLEEVRRLKESGFGKDFYVANAYGYAELLSYFDGEISFEEAVKLAKAKTRAYARRQLTWCRRLPDAFWLEAGCPEETAAKIEPVLQTVLDNQ